MDSELNSNVVNYLNDTKRNDVFVPTGALLMLTCKGCSKIGAVGCVSYKDIEVLRWHRNDEYCPHNAPVVKSKKQKINPLKASKRSQ